MVLIDGNYSVFYVGYSVHIAVLKRTVISHIMLTCCSEHTMLLISPVLIRSINVNIVKTVYIFQQTLLLGTFIIYEKKKVVIFYA